MFFCGCGGNRNDTIENHPPNILTSSSSSSSHQQKIKVTTIEGSSNTSVTPSPSFNKALIHYQLGSALQEKGKIWEAVDAYRCAVKFAPSHYESTYALASALHEIHDFDEAETWYKHALVLRPNDHSCYYQLGYVYQDQNKKQEAVESFRIAAKLDPIDVETLINLGLALKCVGEVHEAIDVYQQAIAIDDKCPMLWFNLGNDTNDKRLIHLLINPILTSSFSSFPLHTNTRPSSSFPHLPPTHPYTCSPSSDLRHYDDAIRSFSHVIRLDRDHVDALFNLAVAYQDRASTFPDVISRQHDLEKAMKCYQEVVRKCPQTEDAASAASSLLSFLESKKASRSRSTSATSSSSSSSKSSTTARQPPPQMR